MEMNRGEAEKCRDIAKRFLREGKWRQAIKFFDKSHRMYPLPGVEAMRERAQQELDKELAGAGAASSHSSGPASGASSSGVRHRAATTPASSSSDDSLRPYSAEQEQMVRKIRACHNHYEVLGVAKDAEDNEIKKAYRKLALKLHPDKNSAPGAEDAFKAVGKAFTILSDPDKRADYDRFGDAGPQQQAARAQRRYQEEDISPEEIFNMFFGGGFRPRRAPHPRQQQQRQQGHAENRGGMANFVQFLPLLLIFIMSLLSIQSPPEVPFSMQPTQQYNIERVTQMSNVVKGIPYYVDREFEQRYTSHYRDLARVEQMVEQYHVAQLSDACESQKQRQKRMIYRARNSRSENREAEMRRALEMKMPACEELRNLRRSRRF